MTKADYTNFKSRTQSIYINRNEVTLINLLIRDKEHRCILQGRYIRYSPKHMDQEFLRRLNDE